jgi:hypothetical protein
MSTPSPYDVFLSYSSKDKSTADAMCAVLEANRIRCWIAPRDIPAGEDWGAAIIDAIARCRVMVLIFSGNANSSPQVKREVERAVNKGVVILPFRIQNILPSQSLEYFISSQHWLDAWTPPLEQHLRRLAARLQAMLAAEAGVAPSLPERSGDRPPGTPNRPRSPIGAGLAVAILAGLLVVGLVGLSPWWARSFSSPQANRASSPGELEASRTEQGKQPRGDPEPPRPGVRPEESSPVTVVKGFPTPGDGLLTEGIGWDGAHLWIAGSAALFEVDTNGKTIEAVDAPGRLGSPAWVGETFWAPNRTSIGQFRIDNGKIRTITSFKSPREVFVGLHDTVAWDGKNLRYADRYKVYSFDTSGKELGSLSFAEEVTALAWDGSHLWIAHRPDFLSAMGPQKARATLKMIDPSGNTVRAASTPFMWIKCMTWGGKHLWVVSGEDYHAKNRIYQLDLSGVMTAPK